MQNKCFGDLSQTSSQYHSILLTSIIATHESYNEDPFKSLQNFDDSVLNSAGSSHKKFNNLIQSLVVSNINDDNFKDIVWKGGDKMQVRYMVGHNENEKILVCAVRGSDTTLDWVQDLNAYMSGTIYDLPGKCHDGFIGRAKQIPIEFFVNKIVNEGYRCIFTGHSLGGAVATLLAVRVLFHEKIKGNSDFTKNILCIGYGTPPVGNAAFSKNIDSICKNNFHFYVFKKDLVVLLPYPINLFFEHFGKFVFLSDNGVYRMSDTFKRKGIPWPADHHCINYFKNVVKILEKDHKQDIYLDVNENRNIQVFDLFCIPTSAIQKSQDGLKCDLTNGCASFCNKYSVAFGVPSRILFRICCKNADFIYKATFQLEGYTQKFIDVKAERARGSENTIEFDFEVPKNQFRDAKGTLFLQTHFEEAKLSVEISRADFGNNIS